MKKALAAPEVQADDELKASGTKELASAKDQLEKAIKRAFQHVVYLAQPDPDGERRLEQLTFDDEHSTSLDGTMMWKALAERDKVFDAGTFSAKALVHNLRDNDCGRSLSDLRASFYSAPRLPLLYAGDRGLQQAIYDAVQAGTVQIVDGAGDPVAVTAPNQVNSLAPGCVWRSPSQLNRKASRADPPPAGLLPRGGPHRRSISQRAARSLQARRPSAKSKSGRSPSRSRETCSGTDQPRKI